MHGDPAGQAADVSAGPRRLGAFVQAAEQQPSLPVHLPFLACAELESQDRPAGHSRDDHDQELRVRGGQLRGAVRPERLRPVPQGGHFPGVKAVRRMALEVPAPARSAGNPPHCRAVPRPGAVGHVRDFPCHLAREPSERPWQSRHGPESSQEPGGYRARHAEVAAADARLAPRPATAEPSRASQYSSANRTSPKPTVVLAGDAGLSLAANLAQAQPMGGLAPGRDHVAGQLIDAGPPPDSRPVSHSIVNRAITNGITDRRPSPFLPGSTLLVQGVLRDARREYLATPIVNTAIGYGRPLPPASDKNVSMRAWWEPLP